jgi:hypothetical protein
MLVKELIYSILDLSKSATSDDSYITEELVIFLCKKFRAFLLKKEQDKNRGSIEVASDFEYQQICLDLEKVAAIDGSPCTGGYYLRSTVALPKILEGTTPRVYPIDFYQGTNISFVSRDKMRYVGNNKYLRNIIYSSIGPDLHLYLNSANQQFLNLKKLRMSAIFEDIEEASKLLCDNQNCDVLNMEFPIREYLVPSLIELVVKDITGAAYKPKDSSNNANDELSDLVSFMRRNAKSSLQQAIEG